MCMAELGGCGLVAQARLINFGQNEVKNFGPENPEKTSRVGPQMRPDEMNKMGTELSLGPNQ